MDQAIAWIKAHSLWLSLASVAMLLGAVLMVPLIVTGLPEDYFLHRRRHREAMPWPSPLHWPLIALKNGVGLILVVLGLIMLLTPGQGLLTLLAGLGLMNFPGKFALERRIARTPGVLRTLNWIRARRGAPPFLTPGTGDDPR